MLMRCKNCGKMFHYEKADGVCPGCGQFCRAPRMTAAPGAPEARRLEEEADEREAQRDLETSSGSAMLLPGPSPGLTVRLSARKLWRMAFFALVLLWACVMAGGFALMGHRQSTFPERAAFLSPVADEVNGSFRRHGREILVTGAEIMGSDYRAGLPQDGCLVRVGLRLDETVWYGNSDEFYLQSGGCYYKAADTYYLGQVYPDLAKNALDSSLLQYTEAQEGWLYFVLPGPPRDTALYLEQADGYGSDRRVSGAAVCPLTFVPAGTEGGEADG